MSWAVDGPSSKRLSEIANAMKDADGLILATDPDREGEAISWHVLEVLRQKRALKDKPVRPRRLQCHHQAVGHRGHGQPAPDRRPAGRRLSGAPGARLPGRLHAVAGAVAKAAGRPLGGPRAIGGAAAGLRPRTRDRAIRPPGILADRRHSRDAARRQLRGASHRLRRQAAAEARHRLERPGRRHPHHARRGELQGAVGGSEADQAQSRPALHDFDPAAGGVLAARLLGGAHDAGCAAPLRRPRCRRRDRRPDHLYAHRRRADGAGSDPGRARRDRPGVRRTLPAGEAALLLRQGEERAGSARGDPADGLLEDAGRGPEVSRCRPGPPLRDHLEARHRQPDAARRDRADHRRDRGGQRRAPRPLCGRSAR